MQPADVLYNMAQAALKKNEQTFQAFQQSMSERKARRDALAAAVAEKNVRKPSAQELKAEEGARKAEAAWRETGVFGHVEPDETVLEEPVRRVAREDAGVRKFGAYEDEV